MGINVVELHLNLGPSYSEVWLPKYPLVSPNTEHLEMVYH